MRIASASVMARVGNAAVFAVIAAAVFVDGAWARTAWVPKSKAMSIAILRIEGRSMGKLKDFVKDVLVLAGTFIG
jgi:hypothetical protein